MTLNAFPLNFRVYFFMCSVNFWHQQDSNSLFGHMTSKCKWPISYRAFFLCNFIWICDLSNLGYAYSRKWHILSVGNCSYNHVPWAFVPYVMLLFSHWKALPWCSICPSEVLVPLPFPPPPKKSLKCLDNAHHPNCYFLPVKLFNHVLTLTKTYMFNCYNNNVYKLIGHTAKSSCLGGCIGVTCISCFSFFFFISSFKILK